MPQLKGSSQLGRGQSGLNLNQISQKRRAMSIKQIKKRQELGSAHGNERGLVRMGVMNTRIMTGVEDLSLWDVEELKHGQRRDKNGRFQGRQPVIVPKKMHDELVRRTLSRAQELMRENLEGAVGVLTALMMDPTVDAKDRITCAKIVMDRVMGKETIKVDVEVKAKWEEALESSIVTIGDAIDVDSWELGQTDDEEDDEDPFT